MVTAPFNTVIQEEKHAEKCGKSITPTEHYQTRPPESQSHRVLRQYERQTRWLFPADVLAGEDAGDDVDSKTAVVRSWCKAPEVGNAG